MMGCLEDERLLWDNNLAKNVIWPVTLGRLCCTLHNLPKAKGLMTSSTSLSKFLDNLAVRINRYISLTQRRLTIDSHAGTEVAVLYHSLAITCHRYSINVFEYLCDIIDRCTAWPPNTPIEIYRNLLSDRWKQTQR